MKSAAIVLALMLLPVTAGAQLQQGWSPDLYRVICPKGAACNARQLQKEAEGFLRKASRAYKSAGWRAPKFLGPVVKSLGGNYVKVFEAIAWGGAPYTGIAQVVCGGDGLDRINIGADYKNWQAPLRYYFIAHELFHAMSRSFALFGSTSSGKCSGVSGWIAESLPTALGLHLMRRAFGNVSAAKPIERWSLTGLRPYHQPLNAVIRGPNGVPYLSASSDPRTKWYYRTSSFWEHLADTYHGGSYDYIKSYIRVSAANRNYLGWLHRRLLVDGDVKAALGPVFAMFNADYATWHDKRPEAPFTAKEWLKEAYGGCPTVTLNRSNAVRQVYLKFRRTAARCVKVKVTGLSKNERVSVKVGVTTAGTDYRLVDQIHLGLAESKDSKKFRCSKAIKNKNLQEMNWCVFDHNTGILKFPGTADRYARIFNVVAQSAGSKGIENLYVLSRVSTNPKTPPDPKDGGDKIGVNVVFTLDFATLKVNGQSKASGKKKVVPTLNLESTTNAQESVPKGDSAGNFAFQMTNPGALKPGQSFPISKSFALPGTFTLRFTQVAVTEGGGYEQSLSDLDTIAAVPLKGQGKNLRPYALKIGDRGSFKAQLMGTIGGQHYFAHKPGRITIEEFTPYMLRAKVTGKLCSLVGMTEQNPCPSPKRINATMVKGFAGLHQPKAKFTVLDTPGTKEYRAIKTHWMNKRGFSPPAMPGGSGPSGPSGPTSPAGPTGRTSGTIDGCKCKCSDMARMQEFGTKFKNRRPTKKEIKKIQRMAHCNERCAPIYMNCAKQKKLRSPSRRKRKSPSRRKGKSHGDQLE